MFYLLYVWICVYIMYAQMTTTKMLIVVFYGLKDLGLFLHSFYFLYCLKFL
jgi:hypothetical protein